MAFHGHLLSSALLSSRRKKAIAMMERNREAAAAHAQINSWLWHIGLRYGGWRFANHSVSEQHSVWLNGVHC